MWYRCPDCNYLVSPRDDKCTVCESKEVKNETLESHEITHSHRKEKRSRI